jgi:hypothetical protein
MFELTMKESMARPLRVVAADPRAARRVRAVCDECGAHVAVVASGASITGACSVCGCQSLQVLDEITPPPRPWRR